MSKKILFGLEDRLNNAENLNRYADVFKSTHQVKLLGVYLSDYNKDEEAHQTGTLSVAPAETDKLKRFTTSLEMEALAEKMGIDFELFTDASLNENLLLKQSSFTDLIMVDGFFLDDFCAGIKSNTLKLLSLMECPVLVNPEAISNVRDVVALFDGRKSSVKAIKAFVDLFKTRMVETPITILSVSPESDEDIEQEKYMINYMIGNLKNVGIQVTDEDEMIKDLERQLRSAQMPMLVLGTTGIDLICANEIFVEIHKNHIPVFFAK